ncbi:MAG: hypothetical protein KGO96_07320 [Elusimicrobia bacterium]|nr:hypothetical protein [Elusimicrobiota bacterium]
MLYFHIDLEKLQEEFGKLEADTIDKIKTSVNILANQTHAHILEKAQEILGSTREAFIKSLRFESPEPDLYIFTVPQNMLWLEDGHGQLDMLNFFLKSRKVQTSKKGNKYLVIPFEHSKSPSSQTPLQSTLADTIKQELKARKISVKKIERNPDGTPKSGLLHRIDKPTNMTASDDKRLNQYWHHKGGAQGISSRIERISVYQTPLFNKDGSPALTSRGLQRAKRSIMTFRTASESQRGSGKWQLPALRGKKFLDDAMSWVEEQWASKVLPDLTKNL